MNSASHTPAVHKHKFLAAALAFLVGGLGLHRYYLASRHWWIYPAWLVAGMVLFTWVGSKATTWILVFALAPVWTGFVEAMAFGVLADEKWDAKFNASSAQRRLELCVHCHCWAAHRHQYFYGHRDFGGAVLLRSRALIFTARRSVSLPARLSRCTTNSWLLARILRGIFESPRD